MPDPHVKAGEKRYLEARAKTSPGPNLSATKRTLHVVRFQQHYLHLICG